MNAPATLTMRSDDERNAVAHLRQSLLWRVKLQLASMPAITPEQYQQMVAIAVSDAQALAQEIAGLFPALDALQRVGWRPGDAFDRAVPPFGAAAGEPQPAPTPAAQAHPVQPVAPPGAPQQQSNEVDQFGRDLKRGFHEMGGAIDGWLGNKKK